MTLKLSRNVYKNNYLEDPKLIFRAFMKIKVKIFTTQLIDLP